MMSTLFPLVGGVGLFLIGMMMLSQGLVDFAGGALRRGLIRFTGTPFKAFASGTLITALVQSSTATTVTLIGFVSAGLITFSQAIGVVIGASLGSTFTGWLVASLGLKVHFSFYTLPFIGLGAMMKLMARGRWAGLGFALAGFGVLFLGLDTLQEGMHGAAGVLNLAGLPVGGFWAHIAVMLIGLALTVLLQSSAAAIATILTALHTGAINFDQAAAVVVGAAIGTTLTSAIVAIGATVSAKRTALAHILFNLVAGLIAIGLLPVLLAVIEFLDDYLGTTDGPLSLTTFHSLFILIGVAIFLPQTPRFARIVQRILPEREGNPARHLDDSLLAVPAIALEAAQRALEETSQAMFGLYRQLLAPPNGRAVASYPDPSSLEQIFDFITRTQVAIDDTALASQRISQLHAVDHLIRMNTRLREQQRAVLELNHPIYRDAVTSSLRMLALVLDDAEPAQDKLDLLRHEATALTELTHQVRHDVLVEAGSHNTSQALRITDGFRWLERTGHHVWRICHYLRNARVHAERDGSLPAEDSPATGREEDDRED